MMAEPLDAPEGVLPNLAAVSFGKVREEGVNAGVQRNHACQFSPTLII